MHETLFDGDARTRFLSAFEDADVLCPEKSSAATPPSPHARELLKSDWALLFGAKAADLFTRPRLPQAPSALLHPSLAAAFFDSLLAADASTLVHSDEARFLKFAEDTFRALVCTHCFGEAHL
ncbi:MAG: hypothetical protein IOD12_12515, partial [Silvanigrellales bacterium]|nr:hypothetical protein [Silvanigrellales bacterium]